MCLDRDAQAAPEAAEQAWSAVHNAGVYFLQDVFVNHEAQIFRRGQIYLESFMARMYYVRHQRQNTRSWFLLKNYWLRRGCRDAPSGLWVIDNFSPDNYHHWLVDVLPRLLLAEGLYPEERVLLLPRYYQRQAYIPFTLQAFPGVNQIGWIGSRGKVRVEHLAFVPRPPVYLHNLIAEVARRVGALATEPGFGRRVYFSRSDARYRKAENEKDVVEVLRSYDFEIIRIDPSRPWEQVRASRGADIIAGVHGAALTNLIFMAPGGRLLEFRHGNDEVFVRAYRALSDVMGVGYRSQVCKLAHEAVGYEMNNANLVVDLDELRENLRLVAE